MSSYVICSSQRWPALAAQSVTSNLGSFELLHLRRLFAALASLLNVPPLQPSRTFVSGDGVSHPEPDQDKPITHELDVCHETSGITLRQPCAKVEL